MSAQPGCTVCGSAATREVYRAATGRSITSLGETVEVAGVLRFCDACGHLMTQELPDLVGYYENHYAISLDSDDDDQLYAVVEGRPVYRVEHQMATLLRIAPPPAGAAVLDFGCAKGAATRKLLAARPDVQAHLFDVTEMYRPFWARHLSGAKVATHSLPAQWQDRFGLVMSFFVLEHVARPTEVLESLARLLTPEGMLYIVVPNTFTNPADFIVADHTNHFSRRSLGTLLTQAGLRALVIDDHAHSGAWVVVAQRADALTPAVHPPPVAGFQVEPAAEVARIARVWSSLGGRVRGFEAASPSPSAIYGSGVYGAFLASCLEHPDRLACFVDRSPFRQGRTMVGRPIVAPETLATEVRRIYVGLNPATARLSIRAIDSWKARSLDMFYIDP